MSLLSAALAALLAVASGAKPEVPPPVCKGQNLLEQARANDPKTVEAYEREASAIPNFGTMHLTDARLAKIPAVVADAIKTSRIVATELASAGDKAASEHDARDLARHIMVENNALSLPEEDVARVQGELKKRGFPAEVIERVQPWFLAASLSIPSCEVARTGRGLLTLDDRIATMARGDGIKVIGLETMIEQTNTLAAIDPGVIRTVVIDSARAGDAVDDVTETMVQLYQERRIALIMAAARLFSQSEDGLKASLAFMADLIVPRNHRMHDRALPELEQGGVFLAMGALHLSGKEGLVELLRSDGYTITRVW
jgi:uncharacterized protein YbaP (TraB family)